MFALHRRGRWASFGAAKGLTNPVRSDTSQAWQFISVPQTGQLRHNMLAAAFEKFSDSTVVCCRTEIQWSGRSAITAIPDQALLDFAMVMAAS